MTAVSTAAGEPFELVEVEIESDGRRIRSFKNAPASLRAIWDASAGHGDTPYLVYDDERYSYRDAHEIVGALAQQLSDAHDVVPGDRVAIAMRNYPEWAFSFWAATSLGAVVVPLNAWWTGPELAYGLADSGTKVLLTDGERFERLEPHLGETSVKAVILARADGANGNVHMWDDVIAVGSSSYELPALDIRPDDDATIMYTSGTTGRPKGAVGTHRNAASHIMNAMYAGASRASSAPAAPGRPVTLLTFPLFHVGGLQSFLLPYTVIGGTIVLLYRWDAVRALELIEREGVNNVAGVPTTMFELLDAARQQGKDLSSLAGVASGATLVPPELVRRIDSQLAHRAAPTNGYGLTETSGAAIANAGRDYLERPDSVGTPISPAMEVRIADFDGKPLPVGETGEIWIKGPTVFRGYFNNEEATASAITDGWFHTGDAGRLDDDGYLYVVDRLKDVIVRGGENVYAAEVEAVLYEHPDVAEAAIVGLPDERYGEQVVAIVRLRPDSPADGDALRAHVAAQLAAFKVPSVVHITPDSLPRNAAGKVLKRELRDTLPT
jgi:acyl-CoA synthetase (AMP-forming)/AMP-acid ligase II